MKKFKSFLWFCRYFFSEKEHTFILTSGKNITEFTDPVLANKKAIEMINNRNSDSVKISLVICSIEFKKEIKTNKQ